MKKNKYIFIFLLAFMFVGNVYCQKHISIDSVTTEKYEAGSMKIKRSYHKEKIIEEIVYDTNGKKKRVTSFYLNATKEEEVVWQDTIRITTYFYKNSKAKEIIVADLKGKVKSVSYYHRNGTLKKVQTGTSFDYYNRKGILRKSEPYSDDGNFK